MIKFGKFSQYGVACLTCLADCYQSRSPKISSSEIASKTGLPKPTVSKTMNKLVLAGFVMSSHGPHGGFALAKDPRQICLMQVVHCFERREGLPCCYKGKGQTRNCLHPLHSSLQTINQSLVSFFEGTTLKELIECKTKALECQEGSAPQPSRLAGSAYRITRRTKRATESTLPIASS